MSPIYNRALTHAELLSMDPAERERRDAAREAEALAGRQEARRRMPNVPDLKFLLAVLWSGRAGEEWSDLTEVEREVRIEEMDRQIRNATNPHHH